GTELAGPGRAQQWQDPTRTPGLAGQHVAGTVDVSAERGQATGQGEEHRPPLQRAAAGDDGDLSGAGAQCGQVGEGGPLVVVEDQVPRGDDGAGLPLL